MIAVAVELQSYYGKVLSLALLPIFIVSFL